MPGGGLSAIAQIASQNLAGHVAMLTVSEDGEDVSEALRLGANAYILKGVSARELRGILTDVSNGETHVAPSLAAKMLTYMTKQQDTASPLDDLTKREEDILRLVATGQSNRVDSARRLRTPVRHVRSALL